MSKTSVLPIVLACALAACGGGSGAAAGIDKTLDVKVDWNSSVLRITNTGAEAAVGRTVTAYINGNPPSAYKATAPLPAVGQSVSVPLREFVLKSGERFNPISHAVTVAWVGGDGYDYQSYKVR
jgi:hypothetical protein